MRANTEQPKSTTIPGESPSGVAQRRILVIRPDRLGDVVLMTPLLRALRQHFPHGHIGALVRPYAAAVLENNPHIDTLLLDDPQSRDAGWSGFWSQRNTLRRLRFDTALMPLPSKRYAWMCLLAGIRQRIATSRKLYNRLTLTRCLSRRNYIPPRHEADYCMDLVRALGVSSDDLRPEICLREAEQATARAALGLGPLIGIHPGSGRSAPNWPVTEYVGLAASLLETFPEARIVVTGTSAEQHLGAAFDALASERILNLVGKQTLRETIAAIAQFAVLVSASTGPMHIASALQVPTVSMFCPLSSCSPILWGPLGNASEVILPPDGYCQNQCPGDPHICLFQSGIAVETVAQRVRTLLQDDRRSTSATAD